MKLTTLLSCTTLLLTTTVLAADYAQEGKRWWSHIQVLADDKMEGRNTGSDGHRKAAQYVSGEFERNGLKPAGTSGYIQPVKFHTRRIVEKDSSLALVRDVGMDAVADRAMSVWFTPEFRERDPATVSRFHEMVRSCPPAGYLGCCAAMREADLRPHVATVRCPVLAVAGAVASGCASSRAQVLEDQPTLSVPPVPPRTIEPPAIVEPPPVEPLPEVALPPADHPLAVARDLSDAASADPARL